MEASNHGLNVGDEFTYPQTSGFRITRIDEEKNQVYIKSLVPPAGEFPVGLKFLTGRLKDKTACLIPKRNLKITIRRKV